MKRKDNFEHYRLLEAPRAGKWKNARNLFPQAGQEITLPSCMGSAWSMETDQESAQTLDNERDTSRPWSCPSGAQVRGDRHLDRRLARDMLFAVTGWRRCQKEGSTGVLFWDGVLWYRSAIALGGSRSQPWGCVGKVRASHLCSVVLSVQHPADTKQHGEAHRSEVVQGQQ